MLHWDTRLPNQDNTISYRYREPTMEEVDSDTFRIAQQLRDSVEYGVDLIFFDAEDYGAPKVIPKQAHQIPGVLDHNIGLSIHIEQVIILNMVF